MNDKLKMTMLGQLGEKIVRSIAVNAGYKVNDTVDMYDSEKDFKIGDNTCEVKTQKLWISENSFSIKGNQLKKCNAVDLLFFVETPHNNNEINIYLSTKKNREWNSRTTKDGRLMYLINKNKLDHISTITDSRLVEQAIEFSNSTYVGK
jgi:hypothetical protein